MIKQTMIHIAPTVAWIISRATFFLYLGILWTFGRRKISGPQGNRVLFILEPTEVRLPEDEEVRKWTAEAGTDKD